MEYSPTIHPMVKPAPGVLPSVEPGRIPRILRILPILTPGRPRNRPACRVVVYPRPYSQPDAGNPGSRATFFGKRLRDVLGHLQKAFAEKHGSRDGVTGVRRAQGPPWQDRRAPAPFRAGNRAARIAAAGGAGFIAQL